MHQQDSMSLGTLELETLRCFQQIIVNGAEAMWHHAGLSNSFWIYAVKAKIYTYNVTLINEQTIKHQKNSGPVKSQTSYT